MVCSSRGNARKRGPCDSMSEVSCCGISCVRFLVVVLTSSFVSAALEVSGVDISGCSCGSVSDCSRVTSGIPWSDGWAGWSVPSGSSVHGARIGFDSGLAANIVIFTRHGGEGLWSCLFDILSYFSQLRSTMISWVSRTFRMDLRYGASSGCMLSGGPSLRSVPLQAKIFLMSMSTKISLAFFKSSGWSSTFLPTRGRIGSILFIIFWICSDAGSKSWNLDGCSDGFSVTTLGLLAVPDRSDAPVAAGVLWPRVGFNRTRLGGRSLAPVAKTSLWSWSNRIKAGSAIVPSGFSCGNLFLINVLATRRLNFLG